ncbi:hypothetical protein D3C74_368360 [compost metagenome]
MTVLATSGSNATGPGDTVRDAQAGVASAGPRSTTRKSSRIRSDWLPPAVSLRSPTQVSPQPLATTSSENVAVVRCCPSGAAWVSTDAGAPLATES